MGIVLARSIFISYARKDRASVDKLTETLRMLGHQVWLDESLSGGVTWWTEILKQIEQSEIFLFVLSHSSLKSKACKTEKAYAQELRKPLLPVMVEQVSATRLPDDLARLQIIFYTEVSQESLIQLVKAVQGMPDAPELPSPMPQPPVVPESYLSELARRAREAKSVEEQIVVISLLGRVAESDEDPEMRAEALAVIDDMARRHDLMAEAEHQIRAVRDRLDSLEPPPVQSSPDPPQSPSPSPSPSPPPSPPPSPSPSPSPSHEPREATVPAAAPEAPQPEVPQPEVPQRESAPPGTHTRSPWLIPIIVCGALLVLVLLIVCLASRGGAASGKDPSTGTSTTTTIRPEARQSWCQACGIQ